MAEGIKVMDEKINISVKEWEIEPGKYYWLWYNALSIVFLEGIEYASNINVLRHNRLYVLYGQ